LHIVYRMKFKLVNNSIIVLMVILSLLSASLYLKVKIMYKMSLFIHEEKKNFLLLLDDYSLTIIQQIKTLKKVQKNKLNINDCN
jgi:hypothetical protein